MEFKAKEYCASIDEYLRAKAEAFGKYEKKTFEALFELMFAEPKEIMIELSDGYRIQEITYGQMKERITSCAPSLARALEPLPQGSIVGLYMGNSPAWLQIFWEIILCGYRPLFMNLRLSDELLEKILAEHGVQAVVSDGKRFSVRTVTSAEALSPSEAPLSPRPFGNEVIFMSSGTTEHIKLCAYTGENFYYQVADTITLMRKSPPIFAHRNGRLKHLVLLPLYHVFGFIAVYIWFGFFAATFVFPKDLTPDTLLKTVKLHEITHIFTVPLVWEKIYQGAMRKIAARGDKTLRKFRKMLRFSNAFGALGTAVAKRTLADVREGLFGDSILCLISGGSSVDPRVLAFFNGIGYHITNGYGMTEVGITSVETDSRKNARNAAPIGSPIGSMEYKCSAEGELLVRGRCMAARIVQDGRECPTDYGSWFLTNDVVRYEKGKYYIEGRHDDLIIGKSGENMNPTVIEALLRTDGCDALCLTADEKGRPVLLASVTNCYTQEGFRKIFSALSSSIRRAKLEDAVTAVLITTEPLLRPSDFKVNRRRIRAECLSGALHAFDARSLRERSEEILSDAEAMVRACFAEALARDADSIGLNDNFFSDLGGTSIDYFTLLSMLKSKCGIRLPDNDREKLVSVSDFCQHIKQME